MPTHHNETLLERYQREHREFEGMNMSKAEELANMLDDLYAVDERPIDKETSTELRRLSAINAELLWAMKVFQTHLEAIVASDWRKWEELATPEEFERWVKCRANHMAVLTGAAIAKAQGEQL